MKKLLTFFLLALLTFSVGWAADLTYTFSSTTEGTLSDAPTGVTATFTANANAYQPGKGVQLTAAKNTLTLTISGFTSSHKLTGITMNYCTNARAGQGTVTATLGGTSVAETYSVVAPSSNGGTLRDAEMTVTETAFNGSNLVIQVVASVNSVYVNSFTVSYAENGGSTTTVNPPTISPTEGDFLSSLQVSISHPDADHIYYTTNGDEPTTSSTEYSGSFTINQTTTVKAIAEKNGVTSTVASATYTKTGVANIAEALTVAQGSQFTFTGSAVVTYQNGRYVWIRDNSGSGLIYRKSGETSTLNNGDILNTNWSATNTTYNSVPEFSNPTGVASSSNGGPVAPFDKTSTGVTSANVNEYVSFSNITPDWDTDLGYSYVTYGNNKVYFRNTFFSYINNGLVATSGNTYNIEGIVYTQNNHVFVYMTKVTPISPTLTANPTSLTINDSGTGNTFTVEGSNLGGDNAGVTHTNSDFAISLSATTGDTYAGNNYQGFTPANGSLTHR